MAKEFQRLSEVTVVEEVKDTSTVLVEVDGEICRAPKASLGAAGMIVELTAVKLSSPT